MDALYYIVIVFVLAYTQTQCGLAVKTGGLRSFNQNQKDGVHSIIVNVCDAFSIVDWDCSHIMIQAAVTKIETACAKHIWKEWFIMSLCLNLIHKQIMYVIIIERAVLKCHLINVIHMSNKRIGEKK